MPNAKWYAEHYSTGDEALFLVHGAVSCIDVTDDYEALELEGQWVSTVDSLTTPVLGPDGYDRLVETCNLDELLAAIERKVGVGQVEKEPEYRTGCHWRDLKTGDKVRVLDSEKGCHVIGEVHVVDRTDPNLPFAVSVGDYVQWVTPTSWVSDSVRQYKWPEGIEYDH